MRSKSGYIAATVICLSLFVSACSSGVDTNHETLTFQGILLHENSVLTTESTEQQIPEGQLISLGFPEGMETPPVGSLYTYEISSAIRESWPPQGSAIKAEEVRALAGHTVISFDTADAILQHLPQNAYFFDVRTAQEYESGHVSGAQNIPVDQVETDIPHLVPEKTDVIILYCRSGNRSAQASEKLEDLGYMVILDAGGIIDYEGEQVSGSDSGPLPGQS